MATTYMNISAVLSDMGKYKESYKLAKKANSMFLDLKEEQLSKIGPQDNSEFHDLVNQVSDYERQIKVNLISSFYNMAVSSQRAGNRQLALDHYSQGYHFALVDLGDEHPFTNIILQNMQKLEVEFAQFLLLKPPPKPKKEEPSARQNDTSYLSGRLLDETGRTTSIKGTQLKSQKDQSTYNKAGNSRMTRSKHRYRRGRKTLP